MNLNSKTRFNPDSSGSSLRPDVTSEMFFVIPTVEFEIGVISCDIKKIFFDITE